MNTEELFDAAFREHQAGNLTEAQPLYQQVLEREPRHADALHLMGVLAFQAGRIDVAEPLIRQAIAVKPLPDYYGNLGLALAGANRYGEAVLEYRRAIALRDDFAEAHNNLANALRRMGKTGEAIAAYRRAIALRPNSSELQNNLGIMLAEDGELEQASAAFQAAISLHANSADARSNLAGVLRRQGESAKAIACWREALSLRPNFPQALNNLGSALKESGELDEAVVCFKQALALQPAFGEAWNNLGVSLFGRKQTADAVSCYRHAIEVRPDHADAYYNLAIALQSSGELNEAIAACRRAVALRPGWPQACNNLGIWLMENAQLPQALLALDDALAAYPDYAEALNNRGNALAQLGRAQEAIASFRRAVSVRADFAEGYSNLGNALKQTGQTQEAIEAFRHALALHPELPEANNNLGNALKDQGDLDEAIGCYERAVDLRPHDAAADSNRVYTLHFHPRYDANGTLAEHQRWNFRHAVGFQSQILAHANDPAPHRRLRIGYVSPDFRDHCQAMFTVPLMSHHDHGGYEIFCYSDVPVSDAITDRLRGYADVWRPIAGMNDDRVADLIRQDRIDILIDLTLHMSNNRLLVFARKPAPVQVTWLGYPGTTGLETMDFRLSDPYLDPPEHDDYYSEETIRLPHSFWCYDPLTDQLPVNELPAVRNGHITFGCLNNFCKINAGTLRLWAQVLRAAPNSHLLLLAPQGAGRQRVLEILQEENIDSSRIEFSPRRPRRQYLELYHRIDIGLDTFPYNGHTTSLDSFWMGVPVVTQIGATAVARGGFSQLSNLGLTELAADSQAGFVATATTLASDTRLLKHLRSTLRDRLMQSPLTDARRFTANMERTYRQMWERWSAARVAEGSETILRPGEVSLSVFAKSNRKREMARRQAS